VTVAVDADLPHVSRALQTAEHTACTGAHDAFPAPGPASLTAADSLSKEACPPSTGEDLSRSVHECSVRDMPAGGLRLGSVTLTASSPLGSAKAQMVRIARWSVQRADATEGCRS